MGNLNSDIRTEKSKFSLFLCVDNVMIGYTKKNRKKLSAEMLLVEGKRNWELKFNTGLALIDLQTNGARIQAKLFTIRNPDYLI